MAEKMRISFAESQTIGFKKWSDAQRPVQQSTPAADVSDARRQKGELTHCAADILGDGK